MEVSSVRWAVNCASWIPSKQEWLRALSSIQPEEKDRVTKFVHAKDAKSSLAGRLLIRSVLVKLLGIDNAALVLGRSEKGRPFPGSFAVLALEKGKKVGVDIMQFTKPRGQSVPDFFHTMRRQFTGNEWQHIRKQDTIQEQLSWFYRFWCLKESFIKAEGSGLSYGLQRLDFLPMTPWPPAPEEVIVGTQLAIDSQANHSWVFQESLIDAEHCVSVAVEVDHTYGQPCGPLQTFTTKTVSELLSNLTPLQTLGEAEWDSFLSLQ